jgi:two-component system cell cycle sensor histidine kinase/response regulator CckA
MLKTPQSPLLPSGQPPEWLLVVDDEQAVCAMVRAAYTDAGIEVEVAQSATDAEAVLAWRQTPPLLVICDVLLPGDDGMTFMRDLAVRLPRTKIVLMSGHLREIAWWPAELREVTFLAKPFRLHDLMSVLAAARIQRGD